MQRNERVDFYKGILIFGVVWGHAITNLLAGDPNNISIHWIMRTYDMPMFMFISGFFLSYSIERRTWKELMRNKITTILFPTMVWDMFISWGQKFGDLYFLWAIFYSSIIVGTVAKLVKSKHIQAWLFFFLTITLNFIPLKFVNMSYLFPFFALGYLICSIKFDYNRYIQNGGGISVFLFVVLLCFWHKSFTIWKTGTFISVNDINLYSIGIVVFRYAIGLVGCFSFVFLSRVFYYYNSQLKGNKLFDFFVRIGKETLAIYILQVFVLFKIVKNLMLLLVDRLGYNPLNMNESLLGYVIAPSLSILIIFVIVKFVEMTKKTKCLKYLFGGKF